MKTTTNTTSTKQLVAVFVADEFYIDGRGYTPHGHAFVNGIRFDDVIPDDVIDLVNSFEPNATMTETEHFATDDGYAPASIIVFTVDQLDTVTPVAATVAVADIADNAPVSNPSFIDIASADKRNFHRLPDDELMARYGMRRERQTAIFTYGNDTDATRTLVYYNVNGMPYVQYHGQLMAIPSHCVKPVNSPVTVSHVAPVKNDAPKSDKKRPYACFEYEGKYYARKATYNDDGVKCFTVDGAHIPADKVNHISNHSTRKLAQTRVDKERKNAKRADKLTRKDETPANGNGCKHIPETYNGLVVDVQNGNMENINRKTAWKDVKELVDELVAAGIKLDCVTYERDYAWVIPHDRSDEFARKNHMVVSMTTKRGHSLKDKRRAWFVKCTK